MISELLDYADIQFKLSKVDKDGYALRDPLDAAYEVDGIKRGLLAKELPLPQLMVNVWSYFYDLHAERGSNGFGPNSINSLQILAWQALNRITLDPWEIKAIRRLDRLFLESQRENKADKKNE